MDTSSIAWLAGLFDGEGTVALYKVRRLDRPKSFAYEKYLCINCGDVRIVQRASEILAELVGHKITVAPDYRPSKLRPSVYFKVQVRRQDDLIIVLNSLVPHLVGKKAEALLLLDLINNHRKGALYTGKFDVVAAAIKIAKRAGYRQVIPNQTEGGIPPSGVCRDLTEDTHSGG